MRQVQFVSLVLISFWVLGMSGCGLIGGDNFCDLFCDKGPECTKTTLEEDLKCDIDDDEFKDLKDDCKKDCEEAYDDLKDSEKEALDECVSCLSDKYPSGSVCEDAEDAEDEFDDMWDDCDKECDDNDVEDASYEIMKEVDLDWEDVADCD